MESCEGCLCSCSECYEGRGMLLVSRGLSNCIKLWLFACGRGAYPISAQQEFRGPQVPRGLCAPSPAPALDPTKGSATGSQTHSYATLLYFCRVPDSPQLGDPDQTFYARMIYYPRSLFRGKGKPCHPGQSWQLLGLLLEQPPHPTPLWPHFGQSKPPHTLACHRALP